MHSLTRFDSIEVPADAVTRITELYDRGLYVQAYELAKQFGDLRGWNGTAARIIGARMAGNLGSRRIANWLYFRAWRADRTHAEASYFCGLTILERRGPLAAWKFVKRLHPQRESVSGHSDLHTLRASILGTFRDFERAEAELAEAEKAGTNLPWVWSERSALYEMEDRYPEALEAVEQSLALRPWFRPSVQRAAHLLQLLGRDDEAAALLQQSLIHIESGACAAQLSAVLEELGQFEEAIAAWNRCRDLNVLFGETELQQWHKRAADLHYLANSRAEAAEHARLANESEFYSKFATRLEDPAYCEAKRVRLPVGFVRQHQLTCVPATLSAVAGYLGQPIDHLELAKEITYDGTADHVERAWVESHGFIVREFRVTWETAVALIDLGIPFTLTTTEITSGHLQAVIGYDALRQTLIVRDPYQRIHSEFCIEPLLKRYAPFGPRGMVLVPEAQTHRIEGLEFPDSAFFDALHRERRAIHRHDRAAAETALHELESLEPSHRLTLVARRDLAYYDGNVPQQLATTEALLALYPEAGAFLYAKSRLLSQLTHRAEHEALLKDLAGKDVDPLFWREWARQLASSALTRGAAHRLLLRVLRFQPLESANLSALADLLWDERDFVQATELYRLSACFRDTIDGFSRSYFIAARHLRESESALRLLRERMQRHGAQSSQPARILFWSLQLLDRSDEAFAVLEQALIERPNDGDLHLHAADAFARQGIADRSEALLASAQPLTSRSSWLRTAATIADYRCNLQRALELWREILAAEPLAEDAQRTTTRLIAEIEGRAAALKAIAALAERFPHHVPLHRLWVEWMRQETAEEREQIVRQALELDPNDAWLRRELAFALAGRQRFDEALEEANASVAIEPQSATAHWVRGNILLRANRRPEARESLRHALKLSIDTPSAISELVLACQTLAEKREEADFVRAELKRQVVFGDGLLAFREFFFPILDPKELLTALIEAREARPDLWHAWSALIRQLVDLRQLDAALVRAKECAERFPSVPASWTDLALVHRLKNQREAEIRALRRALILNPGWGAAARDLAAAHESRAEFEEARRALETAIAAAPLDSENHGALADLLWRRGERAAAIERMITSLKRDPGYGDGWHCLQEWTTQAGEPDRAVEVARELTANRPGEARSWFHLAQMVPRDRTDEALAAVDHAIELSPRFTDAHDTRALILARANRFDEAIAACAPAQFENSIPPGLLIRAAWIEAVRGHLPQAIKQARAAVALHPGFYWGWSEIAEWTFRLGQHTDSFEAAEQLVRLSPRTSPPLGVLARAQYALGRKADAYGTLERAFDLDPTYQFAGFTLFHHYLESRELDGAGRILSRLETHLPGPDTDAARVRLAAKKGERETTIPLLRSLFFNAEASGESLQSAVDACLAAGWPSTVEALLNEVLDQSGVNPEVGAIWVNRFTTASRWEHRKRIYELDPKSPIGRHARFAYLGALGRHRQAKYFDNFLARERGTLGEDVDIWGNVGYAFAALGRWKEAATWLADWQQRKDVRPWMISNLALALRHEGRQDEAANVSQHALTLAGDQTTPGFHSWVALDHALAGRISDAQRHLAHSPVGSGTGLVDAARALALAVVLVETALPERRIPQFNDQRNILRNLRFRDAFRSPILRSIGQRAVDQMAAAAGQRSFQLVRSLDHFSSPSHRSSGPSTGNGFSGVRYIWIVVILLVNLARLAMPSSDRSYIPPSSPRAFATPDFSRLATPKFPVQYRVPAKTPDGFSLDVRAKTQLPELHLEPVPTPAPRKR